jgi:hypothetical protein
LGLFFFFEIFLLVFLIYTFMATNFPLKTAFAVAHRFW